MGVESSGIRCSQPQSDKASACWHCQQANNGIVFEGFWDLCCRVCCCYFVWLTLPLQNARNVLVASNSDAAGGVTAKLSDLGLSRSIKQHNTHRTTNTVSKLVSTANKRVCLAVDSGVGRRQASKVVTARGL